MMLFYIVNDIKIKSKQINKNIRNIMKVKLNI